MDLQVVVIGLVVFVVSAVVIYLISAFTMKEKTFEEVIAEQKRQQEVEDRKAKLEKKAEKDNRRKFKRKEKTKEKSPHGSPHASSVTDSDAKEPKMVNLEIDPEIIEPLEPKPLKLKKKEKPAKSILTNKDEKTPLVAEEFVEDLIHTGPPPKDCLELKHLQETKKQKKEKVLKAEAKVPKLVVEEVMKQTVTAVHAAAPPSVMDNSAMYLHDRDDKDVNTKLISSVKSASLREGEVQSLIEILLNKQGLSPGALSNDWSKKSQKGDPVALLRKQLEEKERSLQEEQVMAMSASTRLKELRQDLNQEKVHHQTMEKSYNEKVDYLNQEIQALHNQIKKIHEQHMAELTRVQQLEAQAGDQGRVQRLAVEENKMLRETLAKTQSESVSASEMTSLKQKVSIMEKELSSNVTKLNASENMKKTLEQKVAKYENDIKNYESSQKSSVNVMEKRVDEVSQELRKSEAKNSSLSKDMLGAKKAVDTAHNEVVSLKASLHKLEQAVCDSDKASHYMEERLKEADRHKIDSEGNLKNLQKRLEDYEKEKGELYTEVKGLQQENNVLADELKSTKEQQQMASEEHDKLAAGAINGDIVTEPQIALTEHKTLLTEKDTAISQLVVEVENKKSDLTSLQRELDVQNKQNIELQETNVKALESLQKSVQADQTKQLAEKDSAISQLVIDIESRKSELSSLQKQLDIQKKKNNELREKNWKAMDALDKSEKSVSAKVQNAITADRCELQTSQTELEGHDRAVFQRLFPDISVSDGLAHKDWMSKFEKDAESHISAIKKGSDNSAKYEGRIRELESKYSDTDKQLAETQSRVGDLGSKLSDAESQYCELEKQLHETEESRDTLQSSVKEAENNYTKLQSQVSQYRSVLAETENKLTQLENSVESEEKKWQERLQTKEDQLEQANHVVEQLRAELIQSKGSKEDISDLDFAYRCVEKSLPLIVDEMTVKVESLEAQLVGSTDHCLLLQSQVTEAEVQVTEHKRLLAEAEKSSAKVSEMNNDLDELRGQMEGEKKKNKELAFQVVKLNGIIKTGHDALTQEQALVEKLKKQFDSGSSQSSAVSNGSSSGASQLRLELEEKERLLEKEISANKLLSQRLVGSQSSLNEAGSQN